MIVDLIPRVRRCLGVSSTYDNTEITDIISSAIRRLLTDFNFPLSRTHVFLGTGAVSPVNGYATLGLSDISFPQPTGFKKEGALYFFDPATGEFSAPLIKAEAFTLPQPDGVNKYYWIENNQIWLDNYIDSDAAGFQLIMLYQSKDVASNEAWITSDFEDAVSYLAIMRGAVDVRKPDLATTYGQLWTDEREALAIYINELEWDGVEMIQNQRQPPPSTRYPVTGG